MNVWTLTACFFVYSFLGWVWEVIYFYVMERRFRSGGITSAPLLPIYGMGAIAVLAVLDLHVDNPFAVFLLSALLASAVEFAGHYFMEKVFHVRLWDYRGNKFNLQGRICLENSLSFGILAMLLVYVVHPVVLNVLGFLPNWALVLAVAVISVLFAVDVANSWRSMVKLRLDTDATTAQTLREVRRGLDGRLIEIRERRKESRGRAWFAEISLRLHRSNVARLERNFDKIQLLAKNHRRFRR